MSPSFIMSLDRTAGRENARRSYPHCWNKTKQADPRELLLKTLDRLKAHLELLAELQGKLNRNPQLNLLVAPEWVRLRDTMLRALEPYPEARLAIAEALNAGK